MTTLKNGPTLPTEVIELALVLEAKRLQFQNDGTVLRVVGDASTLTEPERQVIRQYKLHFMALVDYCESGAVTARRGM